VLHRRQVRDRCTVKPMRHSAREEDLMVGLPDTHLVDELNLRDESAPPEDTILGQVRDVANDEVIGVDVERDR